MEDAATNRMRGMEVRGGKHEVVSYVGLSERRESRRANVFVHTHTHAQKKGLFELLTSKEEKSDIIHTTLRCSL